MRVTYVPKHRKQNWRMPVVDIVENSNSKTGVIPSEVYFDGELFPYHITGLSVETGGFGQLSSITIEVPVDKIAVRRRQ